VAEVTLVRGFYLSDRPWRRLGWILPSVFLAWTSLLWSLGFLLERQPIPPAQIPIDATLIELPPPEARRPETPPRPAPPRAVPPEPAKAIEPEPVPVPSPAAESSAASPSTPPPAVQPQRPVESNRAAARILFRPLPKIPDELRDQALEMEALARFDIKPDGTATVELVRPTPNPALNRIILDTLRTWRFFPALDAGKPVASTQEVRVQLEVR
jgi:periplasmic protein TonB